MRLGNFFKRIQYKQKLLQCLPWFTHTKIHNTQIQSKDKLHVLVEWKIYNCKCESHHFFCCGVVATMTCPPQNALQFRSLYDFLNVKHVFFLSPFLPLFVLCCVVYFSVSSITISAVFLVEGSIKMVRIIITRNIHEVDVHTKSNVMERKKNEQTEYIEH